MKGTYYGVITVLLFVDKGILPPQRGLNDNLQNPDYHNSHNI